MKVILQHDIRDCGAACLAMVSHAFGKKITISKARSLTRTDRIGTNLFGIADGAKQLGLAANALSGSPDELVESIHNGEVRFPFIAHTVSETGFLHFVVVYGMVRGRFRIADPEKGKIKLSAEDFFEKWTGYLVTFEKMPNFKKEKSESVGWKKFFSAIAGQKKRLALVLFISLVIAVIGIAGAYVFEYVIDNMYAAEISDSADSFTDIHDDTELGGEYAGSPGDIPLSGITLDKLSIVFTSLIGLYLLQTGLQIVRSWLIVQVSRTIDIRLTMFYYQHIVDLPIAEVTKWQTGEYLSRFADTSTIRSAISTTMVTLMLDTIMVLACGFMLCRQNGKMFAVSLIMIMLYAILVLCYKKPLECSNRKMLQNDAMLESYFKETIDGVETIKAANANESVKEKAADKFNGFMDTVVHNSVLSMTQDALVSAVEMIGIVIILWLGFVLVLRQQITIGGLITFYALLSYFTEPIKSLIGLQPTIQAAVVAADRLNDMLDIAAEQEEESAKKLPANIRNWSLDRVSFRYGNRELTLKDISMSVQQGEKVALVGESGSGKTTIAKLLLRFFTPEEGVLSIDDEALSEFSLNSLRSNVAYVSQETFLFSDTIRNNLTLGCPNVTEEEIREVCRICRLEKFVDALHLGLETPLDENGANLSGGQRQRMAIARALLKKPQLLILDEATSNLDTVTENAIRQAIAELPGNMACLIIAHRLSTVRSCDRIYVMEDGQIVENGTHGELLNQKGIYFRLWSNQ